ncbi:hypothetical protein AB4345_07940 [Vibrio breoganii]|uniref:hypothetical protein n=1 Tax=Vibrio breoganii TaxID=553239 RepID=UPI000C82A657|nr:hypothetical protein [Vibrio breoganii]PML37168.1 hypothetical protein BCT78_08240 [Vibrio breoganii]
MTAHTMNHQTTKSERTTYTQLDFTSDVRVQVTVGGGAVLVGFFTMACPLMTQALFSQLLSVALSGLATVLVVILSLSGISIQQIASAVGFKRHATLIFSLFLASYSLTLYPEVALFLAAATAIAYFLLDESTTMLLALRSGNLKGMALPGADLLVTLICVAMLLGGLSVHGVFAVSAVLGLKVVLLGSSMVLALSEPKSTAHY